MSFEPVEYSVEVEPLEAWCTLTDPARNQRWVSDAAVRIEGDWVAGGELRWVGDWHGKPMCDTGRVLVCEPGRELAYEHRSRLSGNVTTVRLTLDGRTLAVSQTGFQSFEERAHCAFYWRMALAAIARVTSEA